MKILGNANCTFNNHTGPMDPVKNVPAPVPLPRNATGVEYRGCLRAKQKQEVCPTCFLWTDPTCDYANHTVPVSKDVCRQLNGVNHGYDPVNVPDVKLQYRLPEGAWYEILKIPKRYNDKIIRI